MYPCVTKSARKVSKKEKTDSNGWLTNTFILGENVLRGCHKNQPVIYLQSEVVTEVESMEGGGKVPFGQELPLLGITSESVKECQIMTATSHGGHDWASWGQGDGEFREPSHFSSGAQTAAVLGIVIIQNEGALQNGVALAHGRVVPLSSQRWMVLHLEPCWTIPVCLPISQSLGSFWHTFPQTNKGECCPELWVTVVNVQLRREGIVTPPLQPVS